MVADPNDVYPPAHSDGTSSLYVRARRGHTVSGVTVKDNPWHTPHLSGTHSVDPSEAITV